MFTLSVILALIEKVPAVVRALPEFKQTFDDIVGTFKEKDQATLKARYAELQSENDAGFQRLDDKLEDAKNR